MSQLSYVFVKRLSYDLAPAPPPNPILLNKFFLSLPVCRPESPIELTDVRDGGGGRGGRVAISYNSEKPGAL
jgi:hypothetical protein